VKAVSNVGYVCASPCLGYKSRKLCARTIAVASQDINVPDYLDWYISQETNDNLTAPTTFAVNKSAGAKKPTGKRCRKRSPDITRAS